MSKIPFVHEGETQPVSRFTNARLFVPVIDGRPCGVFDTYQDLRTYMSVDEWYVEQVYAFPRMGSRPISIAEVEAQFNKHGDVDVLEGYTFKIGLSDYAKFPVATGG